MHATQHIRSVSSGSEGPFHRHVLSRPGAKHVVGPRKPYHLSDPLPQGFIRRLRSLDALDEMLRCHGDGCCEVHRPGCMLSCMGGLGSCLGTRSRCCLPGVAFLLLLLLCCAP